MTPEHDLPAGVPRRRMAHDCEPDEPGARMALDWGQAPGQMLETLRAER
jgi:hypothetical protein